jgi:hypothetical protein
MIKSEILWNDEDYNKFIDKNFRDWDYGIMHDSGFQEYPSIAIVHYEHDLDHCTTYRRGMDHYHIEFINFIDFLNTEDQRILDYLQEKVMEKYYDHKE